MKEFLKWGAAIWVSILFLQVIFGHFGNLENTGASTKPAKPSYTPIRSKCTGLVWEHTDKAGDRLKHKESVTINASDHARYARAVKADGRHELATTIKAADAQVGLAKYTGKNAFGATVQGYLICARRGNYGAVTYGLFE